MFQVDELNKEIFKYEDILEKITKYFNNIIRYVTMIELRY